jgi:hypothetical protein
MYYAWWLLPGVTPVEMLVRAPMLWIPIGYVAFEQSHRLVAGTLGSACFWGLLAVWVQCLRARPVSRDQRPAVAAAPIAAA